MLAEGPDGFEPKPNKVVATLRNAEHPLTGGQQPFILRESSLAAVEQATSDTHPLQSSDFYSVVTKAYQRGA